MTEINRYKKVLFKWEYQICFMKLQINMLTIVKKRFIPAYKINIFSYKNMTTENKMPNFNK